MSRLLLFSVNFSTLKAKHAVFSRRPGICELLKTSSCTQCSLADQEYVSSWRSVVLCVLSQTSIRRTIFSLHPRWMFLCSFCRVTHFSRFNPIIPRRYVPEWKTDMESRSLLREVRTQQHCHLYLFIIQKHLSCIIMFADCMCVPTHRLYCTLVR